MGIGSPLGTAEPCLIDGASVVPKGTGVFLSTDFPSVKTLGYFQETQTLNRYLRHRLISATPPASIVPPILITRRISRAGLEPKELLIKSVNLDDGHAG